MKITLNFPDDQRLVEAFDATFTRLPVRQDAKPLLPLESAKDDETEREKNKRETANKIKEVHNRRIAGWNIENAKLAEKPETDQEFVERTTKQWLKKIVLSHENKKISENHRKELKTEL